MGSVVDIGVPGEDMATIPLTPWQAAVRDALDSSDVPVGQRFPTKAEAAAKSAGDAFTATGTVTSPPAAAHTIVPLTTVGFSTAVTTLAIGSQGIKASVACVVQGMALLTYNVSGDAYPFAWPVPPTRMDAGDYLVVKCFWITASSRNMGTVAKNGSTIVIQNQSLFHNSSTTPASVYALLSLNVIKE